MSKTLTIEHVHMDHSGGTKDYDYWFIKNYVARRAVMVTRWGKTGSGGQYKVEEYPIIPSGKLTSLVNAREKRGYGTTYIESQDDISSVLDQVKVLGDKIGSRLRAEWILDGVYGAPETSVMNDEATSKEKGPDPLDAKRPASWGTW